MKFALVKLNRKNTAGTDEIVIEILEALDDFGIGKKRHNKIYNCDDIPEDLSRSIFIACPKIQVKRNVNSIGQFV